MMGRWGGGKGTGRAEEEEGSRLLRGSPWLDVYL